MHARDYVSPRPSTREEGHRFVEEQTDDRCGASSPTILVQHLLKPEPMEEDFGQTSESKENTSMKGSSSRPPTNWLTRIIPPGGLLSTVFNISSICVGAGIVGLPAATNSSGLAMAIIYPVIIVVLSVYSLYCLSMQMEKNSLKTYEEMARALLGRGFDYFSCALRLTITFGALIAFIISVGNIFSAVFENMDVPEYWKSQSGNRLMTFLLWLVVMLPLVIPRHINSLRYVSTVGIGFMIYFVGVIVVHSCMNGLPENVQNIKIIGDTTDTGIHLFGTGNKALSALGVFVFSFLCQINAFEVYWDMPQRSASRFTNYSAIAMLICFLLYASTSFFGYLDFGGKVTDSVLLMYDPIKQPAVMVAYVGVLVKLCSSYSLLSMATRNAIYHVIGWDAETVQFWKHCIAVIAISVAALLCGLFIPKINIVFGFIGGVCGGFLAFIFPALFSMYGGNWSFSSVGLVHYILTYTLLIVGVFVAVFGTCATIYDAVVD